MDKALIKVGNSLAFVLDKPIRKMFGIGPATKLRVSTDGRRIILEPLALESPIAHVPTPGTAVAGDEERLKIDADRVYTRLERRYGMSPERFSKMVPHRRMWEWGGWVGPFRASDATAEDFAGMRRLEACLAALEAGKSWDEAIG